MASPFTACTTNSNGICASLVALHLGRNAHFLNRLRYPSYVNRDNVVIFTRVNITSLWWSFIEFGSSHETSFSVARWMFTCPWMNMASLNSHFCEVRFVQMLLTSVSWTWWVKESWVRTTISWIGIQMNVLFNSDYGLLAEKCEEENCYNHYKQASVIACLLIKSISPKFE